MPELKEEENPFHTPWKDFKEEKPMKGQSVIVLTKYGMHFYCYNADDPLDVMSGLFYIPRNNFVGGLRYSVEQSDITHWVPLPVAYDS